MEGEVEEEEEVIGNEAEIEEEGGREGGGCVGVGRGRGKRMSVRQQW